MDFDETLRKYAELAVTVGLNLQPGQRLIIGDPVFTPGVGCRCVSPSGAPDCRERVPARGEVCRRDAG